MVPPEAGAGGSACQAQACVSRSALDVQPDATHAVTLPAAALTVQLTRQGLPGMVQVFTGLQQYRRGDGDNLPRITISLGL